MKFSIFFYLAFVFSFYLSAQERPYYTDVLTEKEGLSNKEVTCILQDRTGFLWIGTQYGLNRYDGGKFKTFYHKNSDSLSLCGNLIRSISEDQFGMLWIATSNGLSCYDAKNDKFINYLSKSSDPHSLPNNAHLFVFVDKHNQVWVASDKSGISLFNRKTSKFQSFSMLSFKGNFPTNEESKKINLLRVSEDNEGNLWTIAHSSEGIIYKINTISHAIEKFNIPKIKNDAIGHLPSAIYAEDVRNIWVGTWGGLSHFNSKTKAWQLYKNDQSPTLNYSNIIFSISKEDDEQLIVNSGNGYGLFSKKKHTFLYRNNKVNKTIAEVKIAGSTFAAEFTDRQGIHWYIEPEGLSKFDPFSLKFNWLKKPYPGALSLLYKDTTEHILILSAFFGNKYFAIYDEKMAKYIMISDPEIRAFTCCLPLKNKKYLLANSHGELIVFDLNKKTFLPFFDNRFEPKLREKIFSKILFSRKGKLWGIVDGEGLYMVDTASAKAQAYLPNPQGNQFIKSTDIFDLIENRDGRLWILYEYEGITILDSKNQKMIHYKNMPDKSLILPRRSTGTFALDYHGKVWIPGYDGLICRSNDLNSKRPFIFYNNLPADHYYHCIPDQRNHLWITSNNGLLDFDIATGNTQRYSKQDGLPYNQIGEYFTSASDGEMFVCFVDEIMHFYPNKISSNPYGPKPVITSFKVFDKEIKNINLTDGRKECKLPYDQNFISFEFAGLNFSNPQGNIFLYILDGFDETWVNNGNKQYANYTNIGAGTYTFKVKSANEDGVWSKEVAEFTLVIIPPFWQTWWFISVIILSVVFSTYLFFRYKIKRVEEKESIKNQMLDLESKALRSQMSPHFIFNSLNSIQHYILNNDKINSTKYLSKFSRLIRMILENSQSQRISIEDELEALELYIQLEQYRYQDKFEYKIIIDPELFLADIELPPLIIQPFVENAIWHGFMHKNEQGHLLVQLTKELNKLKIVVDDDGVGRVLSASYKVGNEESHLNTAMRVTKERLALLNKNGWFDVSINIIDKDHNAGTIVEIFLPLFSKVNR